MASTYGEMTAGRIPSFASLKREDRVVGGDDDVADGDEADAAAERRAVDAADERHRQRVEQLEHPREVLGVAQVLLTACRRPPSIIQARSAPAQNAGPSPESTIARSVGSLARVSRQRRQRGDDFFVERVPHLGTVQRDAQDAVIVGRIVAAGGDEDGHDDRRALTSGTRRTSASGIGALNAADSPSASAWRVSAGSRIPSSHSRAVE